MSSSRSVVRVVLGLVMTFAGVSHLTFARDEFQAQVPSWFPIDTDVTVLASGVAEIGLGASFLGLPKHKKLVSRLLAAFYVAIFPGNVAQYLEHTDAFGLNSDRARLIRLFFQPVLIAAALFAGGPQRDRADRSLLTRRRSLNQHGSPLFERVGGEPDVEKRAQRLTNPVRRPLVQHPRCRGRGRSRCMADR
jgi:uncharacterized membrane protein